MTVDGDKKVKVVCGECCSRISPQINIIEGKLVVSCKHCGSYHKTNRRVISLTEVAALFQGKYQSKET